MEDDKTAKKPYEKPQIRIEEVGDQEILVITSPDVKKTGKPPKHEH